MSSSYSSSDSTPRPDKFADFDFFDSDKDVENEKNFPAGRPKTAVKNKTLKSPQYQLHGSGVKKQIPPQKKVQKCGSDTSDYSDCETKHAKTKTYTSSTKFEMKRVYRTRSPDNKEKVTIHVPHERSFTKESSRDDDSSSSVTDVSPLPSPEPSPRLRKSRTNEKPLHKGSVAKSESKTKFTIQETGAENEEEERPRARRANGETLSVEDLFNSSDSTAISSGDKDAESQKRKRVQRKKKSRYDEVQHRMEASSRHHRRRLLDTAAENSMDLSQLLEVVLEMEQEKRSRTNISANQSSAGMVPPIVNPRKKNMSFSNEQVRNIDHENQRLLQRLARLNTRQQRPSSASSVRSSASSYRSNTTSSTRSSRRPATAVGRRSSPSQGPRMYHSATNRIRDQQRIERENLEFLKRLQMTKASGVLKRENLLRDYQRQTGRPVEAIRPRRKQKSIYRETEDYENSSRNFEQRNVKPVWQDSW